MARLRSPGTTPTRAHAPLAAIALPLVVVAAAIAWRRGTPPADRAAAVKPPPVFADSEQKPASVVSTRFVEPAAVRSPPAPPAAAVAASVTSGTSERPPPTADALRQDRKEHEADLEASGDGPQPWHDDARRAFTSFEEALDHAGLRRVALASPRCFSAGCEATVTFRDRSDLKTADQAILASDGFHSYKGAKYRSGFEENSDGSVSAAWFLFPPGTRAPFGARAERLGP